MRRAEGLLPLTHLEYALLLALAEEPCHGYALVERIRTASEGLLNPGTGSFYSIVKKLSDEGVVEAITDASSTRGRRSYRITAQGRAVLQAEARRLARSVAAVRRLGLSPSRSRGGR